MKRPKFSADAVLTRFFDRAKSPHCDRIQIVVMSASSFFLIAGQTRIIYKTEISFATPFFAPESLIGRILRVIPWPFGNSLHSTRGFEPRWKTVTSWAKSCELPERLP